MQLKWVSAAEAPRFVKLITEFTEKIKDLGKLGESEGIVEEDLKIRLLAAKTALEKPKLRMAFAKQAVKLKEKRKKGEIELILEEGLRKTIKNELSLNQILLYLEKKPYSISELAEKIGIPSSEVEKHISSLEKKGKISILKDNCYLIRK